MYEYGFKSIKDIFKSFTLEQMERLLEMIDSRKRKEYVMLTSIFHSSKPGELIRQLKMKELVENYRKFKEKKKEE